MEGERKELTLRLEQSQKCVTDLKEKLAKNKSDGQNTEDQVQCPETIISDMFRTFRYPVLIQRIGTRNQALFLTFFCNNLQLRVGENLSFFEKFLEFFAKFLEFFVKYLEFF